MIEIEVNGVRELLADLRQFPEEMESRVIRRMSQIAYDSMQRGAGRHSKTGALFQSIYNRQITGGRQVGHDTGRAPYAKFVLFGTKEHPIAPKNKKALRWVAPGGGFAFSKGHMHPGYVGDNYMEKAKDDAVAAFKSIVDKTLQEVL